MSYHLPVLKNPLVNAVFNCPNPSNSPLKRLYDTLKDKDFILLVPNDYTLLYFKDTASNISFKDLCYTYDFIASHVLLVDHSDKKQKLGEAKMNGDHFFETLNGKEVLIRQSLCFSLNGFYSKRKYQIREVQLLNNFNDYLHGADDFAIVSIDYPLESKEWSFTDELKCLEEDNSDSPDLTMKELPSDKEQHDESVQFAQAFQSYRFRYKKLDTYIQRYRSLDGNETVGSELFHNIVEMTYETIKSEQAFKSFTNIYDLTYEYIESILYIDIWNNLTLHYKERKLDYKPFQLLSLDFLDTGFYQTNFTKFNLQNVICVEKYIERAVDTFKNITTSYTYSTKVDIIIKTFQILTGNDNDGMINESNNLPLIDADTLVNMFILVLCRSEIADVYMHIQYLQLFFKEENDIKFGALGYSISTIEATLSYFVELSNLTQPNVQLEKLQLLKTFLEKIVDPKDDLVPVKQFKNALLYRDEKGQSVLSLFISYMKTEALFDALLNFEDMFPLEDLMNDVDLDGSTLLIKCLKVRNIEGAKMLIDIFQNSCTEDELITYYNKHDHNKRTVAHYLSDEIELLKKIGKYINWRFKDSKGRTALYTIFRSYDQTIYSSTVAIALDQVLQWYEKNNLKFKLADHQDIYGNSLLHILKSHISLLLKFKNIDVNLPNLKGLTPLMTYVKYNRTDNVKRILKDDRLIIQKLQKDKYFNCLDYGKNMAIFNIIGRRLSQDVIFSNAYISCARFENSHWNLYITVLDTDSGEYLTKAVKLKKYYNVINILKQKNMSDFLPYTEMLVHLKQIVEEKSIPQIQRLKTKRSLTFLCQGLSLMLFFNKFNSSILLNEELLSKWIRQNTNAINSEKQSKKYKPLNSDDITTIKAFYEYSLEELKKMDIAIRTLFKLIIFANTKTLDTNISYEIMSKLGTKFRVKQIANEFNQLGSMAPYLHSSLSYKDSIQDFIFIKRCTQNLIEKLNSFTKDKLLIWINKNSRLIEHKGEYRKKFVMDPDHQDNETSDTNVFKYAWNATYKKVDEERLTLAIAEQERDLVHLGNNIKMMHEVLAEEVSNYVRMKSSFNLNSLVRKCTSLNSSQLKEQKLIINEIKK